MLKHIAVGQRRPVRQDAEPSNVAVLEGLDPQFVADDLVDYQHVKVAMEKHKGWENAPGVDPANPFEREEVVKI